MSIIDTHTHIYASQFSKDRDDVIQRAFDSGVDTLLMPNIDVDSVIPMLQIEDKYPGKCISMMGLHPTSVDENYMEQLKAMELWFSKRKFCAVGEVGIDLYWDKTFLSQQIDAFKIQLSWAQKYNLPVVMHVRDSFDEIFQVLDGFDLDGITGVFHSFSGNDDQAQKALSYGCFKLGINGVVTFKNSNLGEVIKKQGLKHLILETDAPYLTPVPYRGKRNEPSYLKFIKAKLAALFKTSEMKVEKVTTHNAKQLFKL
ncbi:TatD DNase family protein [Saccharicrinis carchari]|uniref:TatD DNase family protein n=1 Tax=Saccharicrinis carchari TaxID=1168039 RepID=A0A521DSG1_SACCC|nr:TatD family hydrolase [Saccharicrinis carchari]SMO74535.1 TatD DNase family protein [Saccharicrinis carchari]